MHELSIAQALIAAAEQQLLPHPGRRVRSLTVRIGAMSGCEPDLLAHMYPLAVANTRLAGSRLQIEFQPVRVRCLDCGQEHEVAPHRWVCPACDSLQVQLQSGRELDLCGLELAPLLEA